MWTRLAHIILKYRFFLIGLLIIFTAFMGYQATKVQMSFKFAELVPSSKHESQYFHQFKETFGQDANVLAIGFKDSSIYQLHNFNALASLCDDIRKLEGLNDVVGLPSIYKLQRNDEHRRFDFVKLFNTTPSTQYELDSLIAEFKSIKFYQGHLYNPENNATTVLITLDQKYNDSKKRISLINEIESIVEIFSKETGIYVHFAGLPYVRTTMTREVTSELRMFLFISLGITAVILFLFFRSFSAVISSILVIGVAVISTMGSMALLGYDVSLLTGLIPPIIVVIGIPNCIYLLNKYHQEFVKHNNKIRALSTVIRKIGIVTLITNFTTAIGFLVVVTADITILREFGLVAGINVLGTFVISIILIPTVFSFLPNPKSKHTKHLDFKFTKGLLAKLDYVVMNKRKHVFFITGAIVAISLWGSWKVYSVSYMVEDLPKESRVRKDLEFFERNFGGAMPLEIVIDAHDPTILRNTRFLEKLDEFQNFLAKQPELSASVSILNFIKGARQAYWAGAPDFYAIPTNQDKGRILSYLKRSERGGTDNLLKSLIDTTGQVRISIKVADIGSKAMDTLINYVIVPEANRIFKTSDDKIKQAIDYEITGTTLLFIKGNKYLIINLRESLLMAIALIAIIMGLLFRNVRIVILSIVSNLVPLAVTGALMGYMGIPLKPSTALIFSIAFGISVDDAIHFLAKYRQELFANNFNVKISVQKTIRETGASMIYTSIVLFSGFIIFAFSKFGGTVMLGLLTSTTLLIAMVTNLVLLPSLLITFDSGKRKIGVPILIDSYNEGDELTEESSEEESQETTEQQEKLTTKSEV